jgi:hypothetical protein
MISVYIHNYIFKLTTFQPCIFKFEASDAQLASSVVNNKLADERILT